MDYEFALFIATNVVIFLGYVFISAVIAPNVGAKLWRTRIGGIAFFFLCGLTHLEQAVHAIILGPQMARLDLYLSWHMSAVHAFQAVAVWTFISGLYIEFVQARGHSSA